MSTEPEPQHDAAPDITGPVREYLAVILDALDIPVPARSTDARARFTAEDRISLVRTSLRGLLAADDSNRGSVAFDARWLRTEIERRPINYEVHPTHGKRDAR